MTELELEDLLEAVSAHATESGWGSAAVDYASCTVTVYWKGTPPPALTALSNVEIHSADFSEAELGNAAQRLLTTLIESGSGADVFEAGQNHTMTGLRVGVGPHWRGNLDDLVEASGGIPVEIEVLSGPIKLL